MPIFTIGETLIPYEVKESARAKRMRLTLKTDRFALTVPADTEDISIETFLRSNEKWVCEKWIENLKNPPFNPWPERFEPGAKVFFNGRWEQIIRRTNGPRAKCHISYDRGFIIETSQNERDDADIKDCFVKYFREIYKLGRQFPADTNRLIKTPKNQKDSHGAIANLGNGESNAKRI